MLFDLQIPIRATWRLGQFHLEQHELRKVCDAVKRSLSSSTLTQQQSTLEFRRAACGAIFFFAFAKLRRPTDGHVITLCCCDHSVTLNAPMLLTTKIHAAAPNAIHVAPQAKSA